MKKVLQLFLLLVVSSAGFSQRKQVNCLGDTVKYLSIGKEHKGIGLGNPTDYSGVRLSLIDKNCITNGVSMNMFSDIHSRKTNGVDIGLSQSAGAVNGVSIGLLGNNIDHELRGFGFGTILSEALNIYGVSITGGFQRVDKFHGVCIAGIMYRSFETKGLVLSGIIINNDSIFEGLAITGAVSKIGILEGLSISLSNWSEEVKGVQLGIINKTNYMKGVQFGLINIITENPKWARVFPLINMSFRTNPINFNMNLGGSGGDLFTGGDPCKNGTLNYETTVDTMKNNIPVVSSDSLILAFEKPFNSNVVEFYLDEKLVFPVKGQVVDTASGKQEVFVKIKKSETNFIKVIRKDQYKCMESSWRTKCAILRISSSASNSDTTLFKYTNYFIPGNKQD